MQNEVDELSLQVRTITDDYYSHKIKMEQVYDTLPTTINEVVTAIIEHNFLVRLQPYVTMDDIKTKLRDKLDGVLFFDYCKRRMAKDEDTSK